MLQISAKVCKCLGKRLNWRVSIRFNLQLRVWVTGSGAMRGGPTSTFFRAPTAAEGLEKKGHARNKLETPRGAKSFLRGAQCFLTMSNSF